MRRRYNPSMRYIGLTVFALMSSILLIAEQVDDIPTLLSALSSAKADVRVIPIQSLEQLQATLSARR
jgi:hypothetical protein